jgi:hypothetical protein
MTTSPSGVSKHLLIVCYRGHSEGELIANHYSCLRFDRPYPIEYGPNLLFTF